MLIPMEPRDMANPSTPIFGKAFSLMILDKFYPIFDTSEWLEKTFADWNKTCSTSY